MVSCFRWAGSPWKRRRSEPTRTGTGPATVDGPSQSPNGKRQRLSNRRAGTSWLSCGYDQCGDIAFERSGTKPPRELVRECLRQHVQRPAFL